MNTLMQLKKVCNHPDLFVPRTIFTPISMNGLDFQLPKKLIMPKDNSLNDWVGLMILHRQLYFSNDKKVPNTPSLIQFVQPIIK